VSIQEKFVMRNIEKIKLLAACGLCAGVSNFAAAQPSVINVSGASLLENYVRANASTNDYIDVDGDGIAGSLGSLSIDQLAPTVVGVGNLYPANMRFIVQYRVTGSVNGFIELMKFGCGSAATGADSDVNGILGARPPTVNGVATTAYANRTTYIATGAQTGSLYNQGNPGGAPYRSDLSSNALATFATPPLGSSGGILIDVAPLDVPTRWAAQVSGLANANQTPGAPGYGTNARVSTNRQGTTSGFANLPNSLPPLLNNRNFFNAANPGTANANTIFDNPLSFAVIAPVVNLGVGMTQVTTSELRHLFATGRGAGGENLMVATRDVGSGTRNAWANCLGLDPSWAVGDNVGGLSTLTVNNNLGAQFTPTNKGSNGGMESTLRNTRLGIGYAGAERGVTGSAPGSWLSSNVLEIPSVQNDIYGGTAYTRPTTSSIVHNNANGWVIGGPAILATIGDPNAESIADGGLGRTTPRMCNTAAADYVNNIVRSIEAFVAVPANPDNFGMPGEYAATQFTLTGAQDFVHNFFTPTQLDANPALNLSLQNYTLANSVYNNSRFAAYNTAAAGNVPTRTTGVAYTDGVAGGTTYISQGGAAVTYGTTLAQRNKVAGDFNGDGLRDSNDVTEMVKAFRSRTGGPAWVAPIGTGSIAGAPGTDAVIEILGDFDGDGNFNAADVRYFADGLGLQVSGPHAGQIDRKAAFTAIDNASLANGGPLNIFAVAVKTTGAPYAAGDARGDIYGSGGINRGWAPVGADSTINGFDIDYVYAQFKTNAGVPDGVANWNNLAEAVSFDLSADMNGDLAVDQSDVCELVTGILGTQMGDVNLDGAVDSADEAVVNSHIGVAVPTGTSAWAWGDVSGDGIVNVIDLRIAQGLLNPCGPQCVADMDDGSGLGLQDGGVGIEDLLYYLGEYDAGNLRADVDDGNGNGIPDGGVGIEDLLYYLLRYDAGC
jgi:hypothetical protein